MRAKLPLGIALLVGLPLLGWGLNDLPGFFAHPARLVYVVAIGLILMVAARWYPEAVQTAGDGGKPVRRQRWVVHWLQAVSLLLTVGAPFCDRRSLGVFGDLAVVRYPGLVLAVTGFALMLWARVTLGRQFSLQVTVQPGHRLVTEGLYRHLRHPRYAGILMFLTGLALLHRCWPALLLAAMSAAVLAWRIHDEEALLLQEFGPAWQAYCRRTWRLVPLLY